MAPCPSASSVPSTRPSAVTPKTSAQWLAHYQASLDRAMPLSDSDPLLPAEEIARITRSIQAFQKGESSEGHGLQRRGHSYARRHGDPDYAAAIALFIKEENRHAGYLARFMRLQGIPKLTGHSWTDRVFRALRRPAGVETTLRLLVSAEFVALAYYRRLARATSSPLLARICQRILEDEQHHIRFQMQYIHLTNRLTRFGLGRLMDAGHALLLAGTCLAVWTEHARVLRVEGGFWRFTREVFGAFRAAQRQGAQDAALALEGHCWSDCDGLWGPQAAKG